MDYRSLARVEEQWPIIGRDDLYYGGTSYENKSGLGQQWAAAAESGNVNLFEVGETAVANINGLSLVRTAALYTPGTLINYSEVLNGRLAQPTLTLNEADAEKLMVMEGTAVVINVNGKTINVQAQVNGQAPKGTALLRGVPYLPGVAEFEIQRDPKSLANP
ncbi:MAG: hypothetical protein GY796_28750 [Chloroflexi bacterium]|nr:hypothetical protein [Chloroflexota bacterium]